MPEANEAMIDETPQDETPANAPQGPEETEEDESADAKEVNGEKMVPLTALQKERAERKALKSKMEEMEPQLQQLSTFQQQVTPVLQRIAANPDLVEAVKTGKIGKAAAEPENEDEAVLIGIAKEADLYDASGRPDTERARRLRDTLMKPVEHMIREKVDPLTASTAQARSQANLERLRQVRLKDGSKIDDELLDKWYSALGPEHTQDPNVASLMVMAAMGHQLLSGKPFQKPPQPLGSPLSMENAGGRSGKFTLSPEQQNIAKQLGTDAKAFQKTIEDIDSRDGILED